jgi:ferric-dicitrate binding protein FerR (iron transport regulator)
VLTGAGARPEAPAERLARIRAAAHAEWQKTVARSRRPARRFERWLPVALAAGALLALALMLRSGRGDAPAPAPPTVATVELVRGAGLGVAVGSELAAEVEIETGAADTRERIAIRLADGGSLRLDAGTRVRLVSNHEVALRSGALYVDSEGAAATTPPLEVVTPFGRVREVGTRFEVRLGSETGAGLEVRVRDGRVVLTEDEKRHEIARGEALLVGTDGVAERRAVDPRGPTWDWTLDAAPAPELEGRTLADFLAWLERETGWTIRFEDPDLAESAAGIRLHGSVEGLAPLEAAEVVLAGAGLGHRLEERTLRIGRR